MRPGGLGELGGGWSGMRGALREGEKKGGGAPARVDSLGLRYVARLCLWLLRPLRAAAGALSLLLRVRFSSALRSFGFACELSTRQLGRGRLSPF